VQLEGLKVKALDAEMSAKVSKPYTILDGRALKGAFGTPKGLRDQLEAEERMMTIANPVFMH